MFNALKIPLLVGSLLSPITPNYASSVSTTSNSSLSMNINCNATINIDKVGVSQTWESADEYQGLDYSDINSFSTYNYTSVPYSFYQGQLNFNSDLNYITWVAVFMTIKPSTGGNLTGLDLTNFKYPYFNIIEYNQEYDYYQSVELQPSFKFGGVSNSSTMDLVLNFCFCTYDYDLDQMGYNPIEFTNGYGNIGIPVEYDIKPTEVIDFPQLLFTIISLPFTFFNRAFDLTIFTGTPYQMNISDIIMFILAGLTLIFIIRTIVKLKG